MTLDEAIKHAEEVAEEKFNNAVSIMDKMKSDIALSNAEECKLCAEEHRQLAEWLKDYKRLKEQETRKGHWIDKFGGVYRCSYCREIISIDTVEFPYGITYKYCPYCGSHNSVKIEKEGDKE